MELGFLVVIPTLLVLVVAIISQREIEPLILGCVLGCILLAGTGFLPALIDYGYAAMVDPGFTMVAIASFGFSGLIGLLNYSRGAEAFSEKASKLIRSERSAGIATWLLSWALFVDDYMHAMVVSATMRDIADRFGMPRKVLAHIANGTAAAMAVLIPTTVWSVFFMGIFENDALSSLGLSGYDLYVGSMPFFIYPFVTIVVTLLIGAKIIPALKAMRTAGTVIEDEADSANVDFKPRASYFIVPMVVTIAAAIISGGNIVAGLYLGILVAFAMFYFAKIGKWQTLRTAFLDGAATILPTVIMLFFTFTLVQVNAALGFTEYVVDLASPLINAQLLPVIIFVITSLICFSSGSYWGTAAIVTPIASALAISTGADVFLTLGAIVSAAVFGSCSCIFGDTNNLAGIGAGIKPIEHTLAQLPLCFGEWAVTVAIFAALGFVLA